MGNSPPPRLWSLGFESVAQDVEGKKLAYEVALELRDETIVEGVDLWGISHRQISRLAHVSRGRIEGILVAGHPSTRRHVPPFVLGVPE
jgi:hypothetical protein